LRRQRFNVERELGRAAHSDRAANALAKQLNYGVDVAIAARA
jgi:hypothetical protein